MVPSQEKGGFPLQVREELLPQVEELTWGKIEREITSKDYTAKDRAQQGSEALCLPVNLLRS